MFCRNCGGEIVGDANFCPACGSQIDAIVSSGNNNNVTKRDSGDYDRTVLSRYLYDVRALLCVRNKLENDLNELEKKINSLALPRNIGYPPGGVSSFMAWGMFIISFLFASAFISFGLLTLKLAMKKNALDADTGALLKPFFILGAIFLVLCVIVVIRSIVKHHKAVNQYKAAQANDRQRIAQEHIFKQQLLKQKRDMEGEFEKACELLTNAYDVNIIPQQFRNIYAVYYLYEYISTSNESLSGALLHCNLEELKQRLATVIDQQQQIIINQAVMISQNDQLMEQNNNAIARIAQIEQNTALAAQYSRVAANNAEACAWIGAANYISQNF